MANLGKVPSTRGKTELILKPMRASSFELCTKCRGSFNTISNSSHFATAGTAFHECIGTQLKGGEVDLERIRVKYGLSEADITDMYFALTKVQFDIPATATVIVEEAQKAFVGEYVIEGTPDLLIKYGPDGDITDYKYGRSAVTAAKNNGQLLIYVLLTFINHPELETITARIVQPRLDVVTEHTYQKEGFIDRYMNVIHTVIDECHKAPVQTTGPHCKDCWGNLDCQAFSGSVKDFAAKVSGKYIEHTEDALKVMLPLAKACSNMSFRVEALAKEWVKQNGDLDVSDTKIYRLKEMSRDKIKTEEALKILTGFFSWEELYTILKLTKTDLTKLSREKERGLSKKVYGALEEGGALMTEKYDKFEYSTKKKEISK